MAYAQDLKFSGGQPPCGFESRPRHFSFAANGLSRERGRLALIDDWCCAGYDDRRTAALLPPLPAFFSSRFFTKPPTPPRQLRRDWPRKPDGPKR